MQKKVLNYQVIIEKEGKKFNAYCPSLGLADFGKTMNEAVKRIKSLMTFHMETLTK